MLLLELAQLGESHVLHLKLSEHLAETAEFVLLALHLNYRIENAKEG